MQRTILLLWLLMASLVAYGAEEKVDALKADLARRF